VHIKSLHIIIIIIIRTTAFITIYTDALMMLASARFKLVIIFSHSYSTFILQLQSQLKLTSFHKIQPKLSTTDPSVKYLYLKNISHFFVKVTDTYGLTVL